MSERVRNSLFIWIVGIAAFVFAFSCGHALAQVVDSGLSGNVSWTLDDQGVLDISGNGKMSVSTYSEHEDEYTTWLAPWLDNAKKIRKVIIHDGIEDIDAFAFSGCEQLEYISIPDSVTTIDIFAFENCMNLKRITLPDSVTGIGKSAFSGCSGLTEIVLPDSVASIGESAFSGCSGLTEILLPDSVAGIGKSAFSGCSGLTEIKLPDNITCIADFTFSDCSGLTEINLPDSITSIGSYAFSGCSGLTAINLQDDIVRIGDGVFKNCLNLTRISLPEGLSEIPEAMFYGCRSIEEITIPDSVSFIGYNAFCGCEKIESLVLPDNCREIDVCAFEDCKNLGHINIPEKVKRIDERTFFNCLSLETIIIPHSVIYIGEFAFGNCTALSDVVIQNDTIHIESTAFSRCGNLNLNIYRLEYDYEIESGIGLDVYVALGETVVLDPQVKNSDGSPLEYQWEFGIYDDEDEEIDRRYGNDSTFAVTGDVNLYDGSCVCIITDVYGNEIRASYNIKPDYQKEYWIEIEAGESAVLEINTSVPAGLYTYEWYEDPSTKLEGNTSQMIVTPTADTDYYCLITDQAGNSGKVYFYVYITGKEEEFSVRTVGNPIRNLALGETTTFEVEVKPDSDGVVYEWYYKGFRGTDPSFEVTADLDVDCSDWDLCECLVTNAEGLSDLVWYEVRYNYGSVSPDVIRSGDTVRMQINTKAPDGMYSYQWYQSFPVEKKLEGQTGAALSVTASSHEKYFCRVSDSGGNSLYVDFDVAILNNLTASRVGPEYRSAYPGDQLLFEVDAACTDGEPAYTWIYYYEDKEGRDYTEVLGHEKSLTLTFESGYYYCNLYCEVSDIYGNTTIVDYYLFTYEDSDCGYDDLEWLDPYYIWNNDRTFVTAYRENRSAGSIWLQQERVSAHGSVVTEATCVETGETLYVSDEFTNPAFSVQMISEEIPLAEHDWGETEYLWSDDQKSVTALHVCSRDASHNETETAQVQMEVILSPTDENEGVLRYYASFINPAFSEAEKSERIPAIKDMDALILPSGLRVIEEEAFRGIDCEAVIIPGTCRYIGSKAFAECDKLFYVRLPQGLEVVEEDAFPENDSLIMDFE